jgi:hypothetical protein
MNPFGILIWKWFARKIIALPSFPMFGRRGHMNTTAEKEQETKQED